MDDVKLQVRIEELVLRGIGAGMQHEIRAAMERELASLLRAKGAATLPRRHDDRAQVDAGSFRIESAGATGRTIGVRLARAVYRGIVR